jgi:F-type H+-transporting ATPase subunit b
MEDTLREIGELLLSSIPTIIALLIVWTAYRLIVYPRLQQVLSERHTLTEGAMEQARLAISSAEERTAEYEQRVREARGQIYKEQQARRQQMLNERQTALAQARQQAQEMVASARAALDKDVIAAKAGLHHQAGQLADQIISTVLKSAVAAGGH